MPGTRASGAERREQILRAAYSVAASDGLGETTIMRIAAAADVSPGLVIFHFKTKRLLLIAVLDWLLATTTVLHVGDDIKSLTSPMDRLIALLRQEMHRLSREPLRVRLIFDFWTEGIRDEEIRIRLRDEFRRYREAFRPLVAPVLGVVPERFSGVTPDGLAAVSVSFVKGCAVQSMIDPEHFDIEEYLKAAEGLFMQLGGGAHAW